MSRDTSFDKEKFIVKKSRLSRVITYIYCLFQGKNFSQEMKKIAEEEAIEKERKELSKEWESQKKGYK